MNKKKKIKIIEGNHLNLKLCLECLMKIIDVQLLKNYNIMILFKI
jgi:hypothetical protein